MADDKITPTPPPAPKASEPLTVEAAAAQLGLDGFTLAGVRYANRWAEGSLVTLEAFTAAVAAFNAQEVR